MKHCLFCGASYEVSREDCSACRARPEIVDGFEAHAPDLAHKGSGFQASYFAELARLEAGNFWFRARNEIIVWALKKYASGFKSFLEIGCGSGFVLSRIASNFPEANLTGGEIFTEGLGFAAKRMSSVKLIQMDARNIPFVDEFDVVGAFDVLEHIKEDECAISQIRQALKPEGIMLLSVPQHAWLWSAMDEYAFHERRYSAAELLSKVKTAGFTIIRSTSFVTTLLPAMMISRALRKRRSENFDPSAELKINAALNYCFERLLRAELAGIKIGMDYPAGGSLLLVAQKSSAER